MTNPIGIGDAAEAPLRRADGSPADAYSRAGVDIAAGNAAVSKYREVTSGWRHPSQLGSIGGFSGLFAMPGDERTALVASADGVGTKILIAAELRKYDTVGRDLVNHCVNDILVVNAKPLFFLDYFAVGKLDPDVAASVVSGIQGACKAHDCALLGGETAEMPGVYAPGHFDLAGTIVGMVDRLKVPNPESVRAGDAIIGLPAIGLHTNGYSLARALVPREEWSELVPGTNETFAEAFLEEHPSYLYPVRAIQDVAEVRVMAHITGGGLLENVNRTLPENCKAVFDQAKWTVPPLERELVRRGNLTFEERYRTLNMGVGYTLVVPARDVAAAVSKAPGARVVGWIETRAAGEPPVVILPGSSSEREA